ncbi:hypothetical protein HDU84_000584 [Entophlyctis sp. JEL0112]|nr:hypothetical protein HDU84_000584 [Entophlyctis sp. JEL0112]
MPHENNHHHRSSAKAANKGFKSRHATKGAIKAANKGKVGRGASQTSAAVASAQKRTDRRNAAKIEQKKKRADLLTATRLFSGNNAPPKVVAVVPLCPDVDPIDTMKHIFNALEVDLPADIDSGAPVILPLTNFKQRLLLVPVPRTVPQLIPYIQIADFMLPVMSADVEVDAIGDLAMSTIKSIGVPNILGGVVEHLEKGTDAKHRHAIVKSLQSFLLAHFPLCDGRVYNFKDVDGLAVKDGIPSARLEANAFSRHASSSLPKGSVWRDHHSYIVSEGVEFVNTQDDNGVLKVTGFVRGSKLNANRLISIPGFGEFQIQKITTCPVEHKDEIIPPAVLQIPNTDQQDSLVSFNTPDPLDAEQTWPTEEEIAEADARVAALQHRRLQLGEDYKEDDEMDLENAAVAPQPIAAAAVGAPAQRRTVRAPKGTHPYQAAWIVDSDSGEEEDSDDNDESDDVMDDDDAISKSMADSSADEEEEEEYEEVELEARKNDFDANFNAADDARQYKSYLEAKKKAEEDLQFPDEMDTPRDIPARLRFSKYRGLKSFRTSPWDPYENLPIDYAKIFQFENFKKTKTRTIKEIEESDEGIDVGRRVIVWIEGVPQRVLDTLSCQKPFVVYALMPHENKITLSSIAVRRVDDSKVVIKSKDPMILFVGFRRFLINPIYSADSRSGTNNVHRFERYFHPGQNVIASFYGPVGFENEPVLLFRPNEIGPPTLIAAGTLVAPTPTRIIAKRILLTGHPFKIHKRTAVVRYMFFNPQDVEYFKPVQLTTKHGRVGHIKESLGTHGYMKCIFDEQLGASDTVCLALYKRVYPKWTTVLWRESEQSDGMQ